MFFSIRDDMRREEINRNNLGIKGNRDIGIFGRAEVHHATGKKVSLLHSRGMMPLITLELCSPSLFARVLIELQAKG